MVMVMVMLFLPLSSITLSAFRSVQTGGANLESCTKAEQSQGVAHWHIAVSNRSRANLFVALHYGGRYV